MSAAWAAASAFCSAVPRSDKKKRPDFRSYTLRPCGRLRISSAVTFAGAAYRDLSNGGIYARCRVELSTAEDHHELGHPELFNVFRENSLILFEVGPPAANCGLDLDFVIPRNRNSHTRSSPHPTPARGPSLAAGQEWDTAAGQVAAAGASSMVSAMHALAPILELVTPSPSDSTRRRGHGHCKAALQRWPAKACNATLRTQWTNSSRSMSRAMACLHHMVSDRANTDACTTLFRLAKPTTGPGAPRWQNLMSHVQVQCVGTFIVRSGARAL